MECDDNKGIVAGKERRGESNVGWCERKGREVETVVTGRIDI